MRTFQGERSLTFLIMLKMFVVSFLAVFFFVDMESWQSIHSSSLYLNRILILTMPFLVLFLVYSLKARFDYKKLIFSLCVLDVVFLCVYALYNPVPLNLFVGFLSLNLVLAGLFLMKAETFLIFSLTLLGFTVFLEDRMLLNTSYTTFYFLFNVFSFVVYGLASHFLQRFFIGGNSALGQVNKRLLSQEELNEAVLSSVRSAVLMGDDTNLRALNQSGLSFLETTQAAFVDFIIDGNVGRSAYFEFESRTYRVDESELSLSSESGAKVWLVSEITSELRAQKELEQTRKLSAIGQLSAGLAHEIRNPLAGISGSVELIKDGGLDQEDKSKLFKTVLKEIDRLNALVTDFLGFASPEVKAVDEIQTASFFEEMIRLIKLDPRSEGVELVSKLENQTLMVDQNKIKQVFINLVINAFQAFSKSKDQYQKPPKVSVAGRILDSGYEIKVEDNGDGIKKENLASIFEPFHTTKDKGTGLGLALSHRILDGHGASIDVVSEIDSGTTFTVLFKN